MTDAADFAERLLVLIDQGQSSASYKWALLRALVDCCLEGVSAHGVAPDSVTTRQIAERVVEIYFPHTVPYVEKGVVLRQNDGGQAEVLRWIADFRRTHAPEPSTPL